jgi:hypothetical protein
VEERTGAASKVKHPKSLAGFEGKKIQGQLVIETIHLYLERL